MIHEKFDVRVHKTYALKDVAQAQQVSDSFISRAVKDTC